MNNLNDTAVLNNAYLSEKADFVSNTITELVQLTPSILTERQRALVVNFALAALESSYYKGKTITSAIEAAKYLQLKLASKENEIFAVIYLNNKHEQIQYIEEFQGTVNSATIHYRVIAQRALRLNAAAVIVAHNHPSGDSEPSHRDISITKELCSALSLIDVTLLDHIIVSKTGFTSMKSTGLM